MKLYLKYISIHIKSQLQYRSSFILMSVMQFVLMFSYCISVFLLFERFGGIKGWTLWEVMLCTGVTQTAYPLAECIARGFDGFSSLIVSGGFDRILTRPRSIILQVFGSRFELNRTGRFIEGVVVLIISILNVDISWTPQKLVLLLLMLVSMTVVFISIFVLCASFCFVTIQGLEVTHILEDGGREMSQYPFGIYKKGFVYFFTFLIPLAAANYYPLMYLTGRSDSIWCILSPMLAMLFMFPAAAVFKFGVRKYMSTGN